MAGVLPKARCHPSCCKCPCAREEGSSLNTERSPPWVAGQAQAQPSGTAKGTTTLVQATHRLYLRHYLLTEGEKLYPRNTPGGRRAIWTALSWLWGKEKEVKMKKLDWKNRLWLWQGAAPAVGAVVQFRVGLGSTLMLKGAAEASVIFVSLSANFPSMLQTWFPHVDLCFLKLICTKCFSNITVRTEKMSCGSPNSESSQPTGMMCRWLLWHCP